MDRDGKLRLAFHDLLQNEGHRARPAPRAESLLPPFLVHRLANRYEQIGAVRVMGYNSPLVARDRQFFEVQIPIRELSGLATQ